MNEHAEMAEQIYFANNGAIDLLTGAISQSRFDQIVKRDLQLSHRNQNQLIIISIRFNLNNYLAINNQMGAEQIKTEVESELVIINGQKLYKIKPILSDTIVYSRLEYNSEKLVNFSDRLYIPANSFTDSIDFKYTFQLCNGRYTSHSGKIIK